MKTYKMPALVALSLAFLMLAFQNCSEQLPSNEDSQASGLPMSNPPAPNPASGLRASGAAMMPAAVMEGGRVSASVQLTSTLNQNGLVLTMTLIGPTGQARATQAFSGQNFVAAVSRTFTLNHTFAEASNAGTYSLSLEVRASDNSLLLSQNQLATVSVAPAIRIAAASAMQYTDSTGKTWAPDSGFTGGVPYRQVGNYVVANSSDPYLYSGERYGTVNGVPTAFSWVANVPEAGRYVVRLKFLEGSATAPSQRLFDVAINSLIAFSGLDIFAEGGAAFRAVDKSFNVNVGVSKNITVDFLPGPMRDQTVSAIEVVGAP